MMFTSNPIHLNVSNIFYSPKHLYIYYDLLLQQHFYLRLIHFYAHYYHLTNANTFLAFTLPTNNLFQVS